MTPNHFPTWCRAAVGLALACTHALHATASTAAPASPPAAAAAASAALAGDAGTGGPLDAPIPVAHFARLPQMEQLTLSPDGTRMAALLNDGGRTVLVTRALTDTAAPKAVLASDNREFRFRWVQWANDDRLLVSVEFAARRDFVPTTETRLLSILAGGGGVVNVVRNAPPAGTVATRGNAQQLQDRVIDWMGRRGRHVLMALSEPERVLPAVYRVDVTTGERVMVRPPERDVHDWLTDAQHRVRVAVRTRGHTSTVLATAPDGRDLRPLWTWDRPEDAVEPLGFGLDPQVLYIRAPHDGRQAVFTVRLDDPALARTLRVAHPSRDVEGGLFRDPTTGEVIGLRAVGIARDGDGDGRDAPVREGAGSRQPRAELWDTTWRLQLQAIDAALRGQQVRLVDLSEDGQHYVVHAEGNGRPGRFYVGDRKTGDLVEAGAEYPELHGRTLAAKTVVRIASRDGLGLDAFVTLPPGRRLDDGGPPLSLVLLPHGGPAWRDGTGFDPWAAFFASRGHAVLQVNFRGSTGYGVAFETASLRRWGLEMQDDLTDAVQWAVQRRVAEPSRVCIVGASYGGYAALMGAVKTPDLYRCAISFAGVTDLPDLMQHLSDYVLGNETAEAMFGHAWRDRERLRATSPARQAARIRAPVLLVHGTADRQVPVDQSRTMARALKQAGKSHRYLEFDGGDHQLARQGDRLAFLQAAEAFLAEHLGSAAGTPAGAVGSAAEAVAGR